MKELPVMFGRHQVVLRTDHDDVLAALAQSFQYLRGSGSAGEVVGTVSVLRANGRLACVAADGTRGEAPSPEAAGRWARYQVIERLIDARGDLIWFHGGAVGQRGRAVVLPGRRGRGKSTLVTGLWKRGCTFLTDDILPIDPASHRIAPFPQLPAVRVDPGRDLSDDALGSVPKNDIAITERVEGEALEPAAFVLPAFTRGAATRLVPCSPGEAALALLEGCWNLARYQEGAAACVARLGAQLPVCRVEFSEPDRAADIAMGWVEGVLGR